MDGVGCKDTASKLPLLFLFRVDPLHEVGPSSPGPFPSLGWAVTAPLLSPLCDIRGQAV